MKKLRKSGQFLSYLDLTRQKPSQTILLEQSRKIKTKTRILSGTRQRPGGITRRKYLSYIMIGLETGLPTLLRKDIT